jgi:hypothetical protein
LRLDQHALKFIQAFFHQDGSGGGGGEGGGGDEETVDNDGGDGGGGGAGRDDEAAAASAAATAAEEEAGRAYFQLVEVRATSVRLDYCPRAVVRRCRSNQVDPSPITYDLSNP